MKTPNTYQAIRKRAQALEQDIVRFLADMIRTPSFSGKEEQVIKVIKKEMQKAGLHIIEGVRIPTQGGA